MAQGHKRQVVPKHGRLQITQGEGILIDEHPAILVDGYMRDHITIRIDEEYIDDIVRTRVIAHIKNYHQHDAPPYGLTEKPV